MEKKRRKAGFSAVPFFGDLVALSRLLRDRSASLPWKLFALFVLAYVVSPIDAFPEAFAPLIGWIDDLGLVLAVRLLLDKRLLPYRYPLFAKPAELSSSSLLTTSPGEAPDPKEKSDPDRS